MNQTDELPQTLLDSNFSGRAVILSALDAASVIIAKMGDPRHF